MKFSVVIPAYNEEKFLPRLLASVKVAASNYSGGRDQIEVVVADNDSTDGTAEVANQHGARVAHVAKRRIAAARNGGARAASGEILCFIDADSAIHPNTGKVRRGNVRRKEGASPADLQRTFEARISGGQRREACPCQTIVPLYRNHVFAQIKPTTQTRIDFGLALGDTKKTPKRLIDTGGFAKKDRITHRFEITSLKDIDDEVKKWLKIAYERDA